MGDIKKIKLQQCMLAGVNSTSLQSKILIFYLLLY